MDWRKITHFTEDEFRCQCGCGRADMDEEFVRKLDTIRENLGFPLHINSGFRCPDHNDAVSNSGRDGPHTTGKAADVGVAYGEARRFLLPAVVQFNGVGINQKGQAGQRFIHVDDLGYRCWSY